MLMIFSVISNQAEEIAPTAVQDAAVRCHGKVKWFDTTKGTLNDYLLSNTHYCVLILFAILFVMVSKA